MIELFNIDLLSYTVQTAETAPTHSYTIYWLILLGSMLLSWLVSARMKSRFSEYSQIPIPVTGREVAEQMLKDNHITDVKVISTPGHLTDHYNPANKTVNLSESVYNSNSIAAAAVAAHEVGHAVQHAQAYHWLGLRSALVPIVQLSSNLVGMVLMIGIVLLAMGGSPWVLGLGIGLFAVTTVFAFITLPVEFGRLRQGFEMAGPLPPDELFRPWEGQKRPVLGRHDLRGRRAFLPGHAAVLRVHFPERPRQGIIPRRAAEEKSSSGNLSGLPGPAAGPQPPPGRTPRRAQGK